jgi:hypothetical protein
VPKWTFWYYPPRGHAQLLIPAVGQVWAAAYALTLYGVQGCNYARQQEDGLPTFEVPGHGVQTLNLAQALACRIVRISEAEAGSAAVKRADPR